MRVSGEKINKILDKQIRNSFAQVFSDLKKVDDANVFINDFFSETEIQTFSKRLAVAYWLKKREKL